jgi:hypothetical protein
MRLLLFLSIALPVSAAVDFASTVHPILAGRCAPCHTGDKPQAGFSVASREGILRAVIPGKPEASLLLKKVRGTAGTRMPPGGDSLTDAQITVLTNWISEGAPWTDTAGRPASSWVAPLAPRSPELPLSSFSNPIDKFLAAYFDKHERVFAEPVGDALFLRRATLDVWGMTPSPEQTQEFIADRTPDKRDRLIETLLADRKNYAQQWISFWNDLLRNDQGVNYAGTRKSITPWLLNALETNMPFNKMAWALLDPEKPEDPDGFLVGVNWRGDINASQTPYMQAAQNSAQVFLGVNLKCASCHDSFINRYKLKQSYGLAALFADSAELELVRCDVKTGKHTGPEFLFPEVGSKPASGSLVDRHRAAARSFTDPQNGRFARTMVNRYWQRLFGQGLVANVDDMDAEPWNADLLDWLAWDFARHDYDLQYLLRLIMTSRAYGLPAVAEKDPLKTDAVFAGPKLRRLTAEQFADSLSEITGEWRVSQSGEKAVYAREWELKSTPVTRAMGRPIRDQVFTTREDAATMLQSLELVNGETLAAALRRGALRLNGELPAAPQNLFDSMRMNKGEKKIDIDISGAKQLWLLIDDAGCYDPERTVAGWAGLQAAGPNGQVRIADLPTLSKIARSTLTFEKTKRDDVLVIPVGRPIMYPIEGLGLTRLTGSVGIDDNAKSSDINPNVRFFIFTEKPDRERLLRISGTTPAPLPPKLKQQKALIDNLFWAALSRPPNAQEGLVANQFLLKPGGLEDLLWSLAMHPEFQYVR